MYVFRRKHYDVFTTLIFNPLKTRPDFLLIVKFFLFRDTRKRRGINKHKLEDILMLVILGRLSKCITRAEILQFGKRHLKRLQAKGLFPYGLPLETTLCRVFQSIDNEKMADRMSAFAEVFRREISASARIKDLCAMGLKTP